MILAQVFNKLPLQIKLFIAPLITVALIITFGGVTHHNLGLEKNIMDEINNDNFILTQTSSEFYNAHSNMYKAIAWTSANYDPQQLDSLKKQQLIAFDSILEKIDRIFHDKENDSAEQKMFGELRAEFVKYKESAVASVDMASVDLSVATMLIDSHYQSMRNGFEGLISFYHDTGKISYDNAFLSFTKTLISALSAILVIATLITVLINKIINRHLNEIAVKIRQMADGNLQATVDYVSNDAIGRLSQDVNKMLRKSQTMVRDVSEKTTQILHNATLLNIHGCEVSKEIENDLARTTSAVTATEEMSSSTSEIAKNVVSISTEIDSATTTAAQSKKMVTATISSIKEVNQEIEVASGKVVALSGFSRKIDEIVTAIKDIADQINLLALNAAIEAARAGEQGRGFAVVADEVRRLAHRTATATSEINNILSSIRSGTLEATTLMNSSVQKAKTTEELAERMGGSFMVIYSSLTQISSFSRQVADETKKQSFTSTEIAKNLSALSEDATKRSHIINEMILSFHKFGVNAKDFLKLLNHYRDPILRLRVTKSDYTLWIYRVLELFSNKETLYLPSEFDPKLTRMGKWFHGKGKTAFGNNPAFVALGPLHIELHNLGARIKNALTKHQANEAYQLFMDLMKLDEKIMSILDQLETDDYGCQLLEEIVID
ncbi:methyl-accepting chemotaxis protein [Gammaproteobacteria bacterium]